MFCLMSVTCSSVCCRHVNPAFVSSVANGNDSKKFKGDIRGPGVPSRVIHIRKLPNDITEAEVISLGLPFGDVTNLLMLKAKNQVQDVDLFFIFIFFILCIYFFMSHRTSLCSWARNWAANCKYSPAHTIPKDCSEQGHSLSF